MVLDRSLTFGLMAEPSGTGPRTTVISVILAGDYPANKPGLNKRVLLACRPG